MKTITPLLLCVLIFQSCATLLNSDTTRVKIKANTPITVSYNNETSKSAKDELEITPLRQKDSLQFTVNSGTLSKSYTFSSKKAIEFWGNIPITYGLGMLIDYTNDKRFDYKSEYYFEIDSLNNTINYLKIRNRERELFLAISMPYFNSFQLNRRDNSNIKSTGFLGFGLGLEYFYTKTNFVDVNASGFMDFFIPVPAPISGDSNTIRAFNISATNNHLLNRVSLGYGLGYSAKHFRSEEEGDVLENVYSNTLSFIAPAYYHFNPNFRIGIIYRPSLFDLGRANNFNYEHSISVDLKWSVKLFKF